MDWRSEARKDWAWSFLRVVDLCEAIVWFGLVWFGARRREIVVLFFTDPR